MATPALRMVSATVEGMSEDNLETMMSVFFFTQSPLSWGQIVVALHDHKHVVDADAQEEERNNVVHGPVEKTHSRADAIGEPNCKPNGSKTYRICR